MRSNFSIVFCLLCFFGVNVSEANFVQDKRISDSFDAFVACVQETKKPYRCTGTYAKFVNLALEAKTSLAEQKLNQTQEFLEKATQILERKIAENKSIEDRRNLIKLYGMIEITTLKTTERDNVSQIQEEISAIISVRENKRLEAELRGKFSQAEDHANACFDDPDTRFCSEALRSAQQAFSALADNFSKPEISEEFNGLESLFARAKKRAKNSLQIIDQKGLLKNKINAAEAAQDLLLALAEYEILEFDKQLVEKIATLESDAARTLDLLQKAEHARRTIESNEISAEIVESLQEVFRETKQQHGTRLPVSLKNKILAIDKIIASRLELGFETIEAFLLAVSDSGEIETAKSMKGLLPALHLSIQSCILLDEKIFVDSSANCANFLISGNASVRDEFKMAISNIENQLEINVTSLGLPRSNDELRITEKKLSDRIEIFDGLARLCTDLFLNNKYISFNCLGEIDNVVVGFERKKISMVSKLLLSTLETRGDRWAKLDKYSKTLSERVRLASSLEDQNLTVNEKRKFEEEKHESFEIDLPEVSKAVEEHVTSGLSALAKFKKQVAKFKFNDNFQPNVRIERYHEQIEKLKFTLMFVVQVRMESEPLFNAVVIDGPPILREHMRITSVIEEATKAENTIAGILEVAKFAKVLRADSEINFAEALSSNTVDDLEVLLGSQQFDADTFGFFIFKQIERDFDLKASAFSEKYGNLLPYLDRLLRKSPKFLEAFSEGFFGIVSKNSMRRGGDVFLQQLDLTWVPDEESQEIFRELINNGYPVSEIFRVLEQFQFEIGGLFEDPSEMLELLTDYAPTNENRLTRLLKDAKSSGGINFKGFYPGMGLNSVTELLNIYLPNCIAAASFDEEIKVRPVEYIIGEDVNNFSSGYEMVSKVEYIGYESNDFNVVASAAFETVRKFSILEGWVPIDCESIKRRSDDATGWNGNAVKVSGSRKNGLERVILSKPAIDRIWGVEDLSSEGFADAFYENYLDDWSKGASSRVQIEDVEPFGRFVLFEDLGAGIQLKVFETRKEIILQVIRGARNIEFN